MVPPMWYGAAAAVHTVQFVHARVVLPPPAGGYTVGTRVWLALFVPVTPEPTLAVGCGW